MNFYIHFIDSYNKIIYQNTFGKSIVKENTNTEVQNLFAKIGLQWHTSGPTGQSTERFARDFFHD